MYVLSQGGLLLIVLFIAACPGLRFLRLTGFEGDDPLERFVLSAACGFALITLGLLLLGMTGLFSPLLILVLPILLFVISIKEALYFVNAFISSVGSFRIRDTAQIALGIIFCGFVIINLLKALLPPHGPTDLFYYHLTLPKLFLAHEKLVTYPTFFPSFFPSNGELLFSLAFVLSGPIFANCIHFGFGLLTVLALYVYSRKYVSKAYALLPGMLFLTAPVVNSWGTMAYTANMVGVYVFLVCMLLLERSGKKGEIPVLGLLIGMALGTKYQAIPLLGFTIGGIGLLRCKDTGIIRTIAGALCIGVILASPWYIRNLLITGNPCFPILGDIFSSPFIRDEMTWGNDTSVSGALLSSIKRIAGDPLAPISFLFTYAWNSDDYQRFIGPFFLGLLPFSLFIRKSGIIRSLLFLTLGLCFFTPFLLRGNMRYAIILVICMSFLGGAVLQEVMVYARMAEKRALTVVLGVFIICLGLHCYHTKLSNGRVHAAVNPGLARSFLQVYERSFLPAQCANEKIPSGSKVLFHGTVRYYYFGFEPLNEYLRQTVIRYDHATDGKGIYTILANQGITHIVHDDLMHEKRRASHIFYEDDPRFIEFMTRHLRKLGSRNGMSIYALHP